MPDRDFLLDQLRTSADVFLSSFAAMTPAQLEFRIEPGRWSIAETVEHVALAEVGSGRLMRGRLVREPASPELLAQTGDGNERIERALRIRDRVIPAPDLVLPKGTWPDAHAAGAAFLESRHATIAFLAQAEADLTRHAAPHPILGPLDGLQWAHFLIRHCLRHRDQIQETARAAGFPAA